MHVISPILCLSSSLLSLAGVSSPILQTNVLYTLRVNCTLQDLSLTADTSKEEEENKQLASLNQPAIPPLNIQDADPVTEEVVIKPGNDRSSAVPEESLGVMSCTLPEFLQQMKIAG